MPVAPTAPLELRLDVTPGHCAINNGKMCVCRGKFPKFVLVKKYRDAKASIESQVEDCIIGQGRRFPVFSSGPVRVEVDTYAARTHRSGSAIGLPFIDVDATVKCVLDALSGLAYEDDAQVVRVVARKHNKDEGTGIAVRVELEETTK